MILPIISVLSAPLWLVNALHILTLTLHFAGMNFLLGGLVVILFGKFSDRWNNPTVRDFIRLAPSAMAFTITFGVAPLLFTQLIYHDQVYSAAIIGAWFWLMIVVVTIVAYFMLYAASFGSKKGKNVGVFLGVALFCMIYVSFVYTNVFSLSENPELMKEVYAADQSGLALNPDLGAWLIRWFHTLLGAVTVGGFFIGLIGRNDEEGYKVGKLFFIGGMAAAMMIGMVYLMTLADMMKPFMRGPGIRWMTVSILLSLGSLHFFMKKRWIAVSAMLGAALLGMVATRHEVRLLRLSDTFDPSTIPVQPEWIPVLIFLASFVLAVSLLTYMIKRFLASADSR